LGLLGIPSFSNSLAGQPLPGSFFVVVTLSVLTFWHNVLIRAWHRGDELFYECGYLACFDAPRNKSRSAPVRLMCFMGRQSYEVYLFHGIVLAVLRNVIPKGTMPYVYKLPMFVLFVIASVLLAGAVARYYAEPANALLRERLMARRTAQA
jgi:peptidoglycan/LPS O-acetylase OafA/YrhL